MRFYLSSIFCTILLYACLGFLSLNSCSVAINCWLVTFFFLFFFYMPCAPISFSCHILLSLLSLVKLNMPAFALFICSSNCLHSSWNHSLLSLSFHVPNPNSLARVFITFWVPFRGFSCSFITNMFYRVGLLAEHPPWSTRVLLCVWLISLELSSMGGPTSSIATASIALRIIGPHSPHHSVKVLVPWGEGGGG